MSCAFEEDLTAYLDGELAPEQAMKVEQHLPGCAGCQATHALLQGTLAKLSGLPAFEPSRDLRRNVLNAVDALPRPLGERLREILRPSYLVPAGGLIAAAIVATVAFEHRHPQPAPLSPNAELELAMNYDVIDNYEVLGVDSPDDLDVVEHLSELEKTP
jgi:anti-sigma factor RsiW